VGVGECMHGAHAGVWCVVCGGGGGGWVQEGWVYEGRAGARARAGIEAALAQPGQPRIIYGGLGRARWRAGAHESAVFVCVRVHWWPPCAHTGRNASRGTLIRGALNLCDLAGSERLSRSQAEGKRLTETQAINKSLSALVDVFSALSKKASHVRTGFIMFSAARACGRWNACVRACRGGTDRIAACVHVCMCACVHVCMCACVHVCADMGVWVCARAGAFPELQTH
jgi:hypothetical protein